jgi:hypothetical protein
MYNFNSGTNITDSFIKKDKFGNEFIDDDKSISRQETEVIKAAVNKFPSDPESSVPECGLKSEIPENQQMANCNNLSEHSLLIRNENNNQVLYESATNSTKHLSKIQEALYKFSKTKDVPKSAPIFIP